MHTELQKVDCFFQKAQAEVSIKFEIITEGMSITQGQTTSLVKDKWSTTAKSVFALYRDLLMLEIFCIMVSRKQDKCLFVFCTFGAYTLTLSSHQQSFCAFSKALKKHDKITNHDTRAAFMNRVVSKAKFASYPALSEMIEKCEKIHKEVTDELIATGTQDLLEDERLFIETVRSLNAEAVSVAHEEGATDIRPRPILGASWSQKQQMNGDISPHGQETEDTEKPASKKLKQEN